MDEEVDKILSPQYSTLKLKAAWPSGTLVSNQHTARRNNPEIHEFYRHSRVNLKSRTRYNNKFH